MSRTDIIENAEYKWQEYVSKYRGIEYILSIDELTNAVSNPELLDSEAEALGWKLLLNAYDEWNDYYND